MAFTWIYESPEYKAMVVGINAYQWGRQKTNECTEYDARKMWEFQCAAALSCLEERSTNLDAMIRRYQFW